MRFENEGDQKSQLVASHRRNNRRQVDFGSLTVPEQKSEAYLDRYEVVAVALPGAALLLFLVYLDPSIIGTSHLELKDVTVGALGIFTIASVIVGQVVQAVGNIVEEIVNRIADMVADSPVASLPEHRRREFYNTVAALGIERPNEISRRRYRKELGKDIVRAGRQGDTSGVLQVFNVTYGLNRGLSIAAGTAFIIAAGEKQIAAAIAFLVMFLTVSYRAYRFSRRYEGEALRIFIDAGASGSSSEQS